MNRACFPVAAIALAALPLFFQPAGAQTTIRVPALSGAQPDAFSGRPRISADGRYVAFESNATNLVAGDTNGLTDIFVRDLQTGTTTRVSVAGDGTEGNSYSLFPAISADGRYVAFESLASNLVPGDNNKTWDIFIHDTTTGTTRRATVATDGTEGNAPSNHAVLSADGRYVAFESLADNLVAGDTNHFGDVFRHDTVTGTTERVSVSSSGQQGNRGAGYRPAISADGRYVTFGSFSSDLVPNDNNNQTDIFRRDMQAGTTVRVSVPAGGGESNGLSSNMDMSADGRTIVFFSLASNLVPGDTNDAGDVFIYNIETSALTRIAVGGDETQWIYGTLAPSISRDGRFVAFSSDAPDILPGQTNGILQVYRYEVATGAMDLISATPAGAPGDNFSYSPSLNGDGSVVAFTSEAANLVAGDTNAKGDIFVRTIAPPTDFDATRDALKIAGGLTAATSGDLARLGVSSGGRVDILAAVRLARKAVGTD